MIGLSQTSYYLAARLLEWPEGYYLTPDGIPTTSGLRWYWDGPGQLAVQDGIMARMTPHFPYGYLVEADH